MNDNEPTDNVIVVCFDGPRLLADMVGEILDRVEISIERRRVYGILEPEPLPPAELADLIDDRDPLEPWQNDRAPPHVPMLRSLSGRPRIRGPPGVRRPAWTP